MTRWLLASLLSVALAACATPVPSAPATAAPGPGTQALDAAIAGAWRAPGAVARDRYRHPRQTLAFFGIAPTATVIEITPGGGWYSEILAPYLEAHGQYIAALARPARAGSEAAGDKQAIALKFAADPTHYRHAATLEFDPSAPAFGPPASADTVLTFRNVHNWVMAGTQAATFRGFFAVLKPGGVLGVTDHRADPGPATDGRRGYVTEQQVIDLATAAGFRLQARSDINANPADHKAYPQGVWTLPPTLQLGQVDRARYLTIGESDRMTLRFIKPRRD